MHYQTIVVSLVLLAVLVAACAAPVPQSTPQPTPTPQIGMPNPASQNCIQKGGKLTIEKRGDGGEFGVCWFEDARQCEEWALLRGECPVGGLKVTGYGPQGRYCTITGGQYTVTGGDMANEKGTCTFQNGKQCDGADYFNGKCSP